MQNLLLDLDGTLVDPARGIVRSFQAALMDLAFPPPASDDLTWIIGPPLRDTFRKVLGSDDQVENALACYRRHYSSAGIYDADVYAGVREALATLKAEGRRLVICTSKLESFARSVLDHFELRSLVDEVYGAELGGRLDDKGVLIADILLKEKFSVAETVMIGDRLHDIHAARRHGVVSIGVLWGYGGKDELVEAGATLLCASPHQLVECVRQLTVSC